MIKDNDAEAPGGLTLPKFEVLCGYDNERPHKSYIVGKTWTFLEDEAQTSKDCTIDFTVDLRGWVVGKPFEGGNPDLMVKILTLKSSNQNVIGLYIDGDRFRFEVRPTDDRPTQYLYWHPGRMAGRHHFTVTSIQRKPENAAGGNVRWYANGRQIGRIKDVPVVRLAEKGNSHYWLLGLDCRRGVPTGVAYRRAVFDLIQTNP